MNTRQVQGDGVRARLDAALRERVLLLDGAMGTMIQRRRLGEADFRGERFASHARDLAGDNDLLALTRPDVIEAIHDEFLAAGADIIETNTFNSERVSRRLTTTSQTHRLRAQLSRQLNLAKRR